MIDIIYKTVKPSYLEKLEIIQNTNSQMFQVIFIIFCFNFDKANQSFLQPSLLLGETDFQKILPGVLTGEQGHE